MLCKAASRLTLELRHNLKEFIKSLSIAVLCHYTALEMTDQCQSVMQLHET